RKAAVLWNRQVIGLVHGLFRLRHGKAFNALRVRSGLLPADETPVLQQTGDIPMTLALWSERFAPLFPDRAGQWRPTGFPRAPEGTLPTGAQAWLDAGPPPLVVTLGSIGQTIAGPRFWPEAVALARALGLRAVLLHGKAEVPKGPDVLALPYGAHAHLFPQAAAILHHGGIGTTAEALRAGKPQLVVPIGGDQFDNAARLERLGFGTTLPARRFTAARATRRLRALLDRIDYPALGALADQIQAEDGARVAALHLIRAAGISAPP
ncbi:MAG: nucleotide disphospho-sugar-binding domain-containing protein, partial [Pseudomonadota bacterium]